MRWVIGSLMVLSMAGIVHAQDVKPDLDKLLKETQKQLKEAQDRKAELASANEKLSSHITELEKASKEQAAQIDDLKRQVAAFADRTLFLTTHYNTWKQFIGANPTIKAQWEVFEKITSVVAPQSAIFMDTEWPLSVDQ
jgi:uncharacterized phage infection (PIP) family protein YhgE